MLTTKLLSLTSLYSIFTNTLSNCFVLNIKQVILFLVLNYSCLNSKKLIPLYISYHQSVSYGSKGELTKEVWILGYFFLGDRALIDINSLALKNNFNSLESLWRIFGWQEREVLEFTGLTSTNKRDSRSLFLFFLIGGNPINKSFPVIGLWSLTLDLNSNLSWTRSLTNLQWDLFYLLLDLKN